MGTNTMESVLVTIKVENITDSLEASAGRLSPDRIRSIEIDDAVINTGARLLALPKRHIQTLGLERFETREAVTSAGIIPCNLYRAAWLTIQGRRCTVDVAEVPDECAALVGYVPLELLDFVVDPVGRQLIGNPAHHGQNILDLF